MLERVGILFFLCGVNSCKKLSRYFLMLIMCFWYCKIKKVKIPFLDCIHGFLQRENFQKFLYNMHCTTTCRTKNIKCCRCGTCIHALCSAMELDDPMLALGNDSEVLSTYFFQPDYLGKFLYFVFVKSDCILLLIFI
jgi:hypothetical protein